MSGREEAGEGRINKSKKLLNHWSESSVVSQAPKGQAGERTVLSTPSYYYSGYRPVWCLATRPPCSVLAKSSCGHLL
jgi:hypothetical protein